MLKTIEDYLEQANQKYAVDIIAALEKLAGYADVRALNAIQNAYFHSHPAVRTAAARVTAVRLDVSLFDALLSLLDDEEPQVRLAAVMTLGLYASKGINEERALTELLKRQPEPQTNQAVKDILIRAGSKIIPMLEMELVSFDENRSQRALEILPEIGDLGIMALLEHMPQLQKAGRLKAARELGKVNHPILVDYFLNLMSSMDSETRRFAMAAISNSAVSIKAIEICGNALINDPEQAVRMDSAHYLAWVKHPMTLTYLQKYDASKEKGLYGKWIREIIKDWRRLLELQELSLTDVHLLLFAGSTNDRVLAAAEVSRREDPMSIPFLARALRHERAADPQAHLLVSLSDLGAVEAVDDILDCATEMRTDREDRLLLETLGELGHPKALPYLQQRAGEVIYNDIPSLTQPVYAARESVKTIQERIGFLSHAWFRMDDENDDKRIIIAMMLAMHGDARGVDMLGTKFESMHHPAMRYQVLRALGQSGSLFVLPFLKKQLEKPEERLVWHAIIAIGQLPVTKAPAELKGMMLDSSSVIRSAVLFALGRIADPETLPIVLLRLKDADPQVRALAVQTLHNFNYDASWRGWLEKTAADDSFWVRLETARLIKAKDISMPPMILKSMLTDTNLDVRMIALERVQTILSEDFREALQICASIKGGMAPRKARELLDRLDYLQDPQAYMKKKEHEETIARERKRAADERKLRKAAGKVLADLSTQGWQSVFITHVAGAAYVDWKEFYKDINVGDVLSLKRESENVFDINAILVINTQGEKLGYVPQYLNKNLAKSMDEGCEAVGAVLEVRMGSRLPVLTIEVFKKAGS